MAFLRTVFAKPRAIKKRRVELLVAEAVALLVTFELDSTAAIFNLTLMPRTFILLSGEELK